MEIPLKRCGVREEESEEKDETQWTVVVWGSIIEIEEVEKLIAKCSEEEERGVEEEEREEREVEEESKKEGESELKRVIGGRTWGN